MVLGASSPSTRERNVTSRITPTEAAVSAASPSRGRRPASRYRVRLPPANTALMVPIRVMPICTVARNAPGRSASRRACCAPRWPLNACA